MKEMSKGRTIRVEIAREALESVFKECDQYDHEETGGRVVGHFSVDRETLVVQVEGVIEPGPKARRTSTSFFQDGYYQTEVFRRLEAKDPSIEHLGNWHTHHVNGYPTLSNGDLATYRRIVNHDQHNTDFFYALLVTSRNSGQTGLERYNVRHYVLFRGDNSVHEIPPTKVKLTDRPRIWPKEVGDSKHAPDAGGAEGDESRRKVGVRARDQSVLEVLCPSMEPRLSSETGTFFWKGSVSLINGSELEIRVGEVEDDGEMVYFPVVSGAYEELTDLCKTPFQSASHAIRALESRMNREIYESVKTLMDGLSPSTPNNESPSCEASRSGPTIPAGDGRDGLERHVQGEVATGP